MIKNHASMEIRPAVTDMWRKPILPGNLDVGQINEDKIAAFRDGVGKIQFLKDLPKPNYFLSNQRARLRPKAVI